MQACADVMEVNHGPRPPYDATETVVDQLRRHVARTPDAPAVVLPEGEQQEGVRLTLSYAELWEIVLGVAQALARARAVRHAVGAARAATGSSAGLRCVGHAAGGLRLCARGRGHGGGSSAHAVRAHRAQLLHWRGGWRLAAHERGSGVWSAVRRVP